MRRFLFVTLFVLITAPALAQNLCDATVPNNPNVANPFRVQFGWDGKDSAGTVLDAATVATVQVRVTHDGTARPLVALPVPTGTTTASGCKWYVLPGYSLPKGAHTQVVTLVSPDGEGAVTTPFAFVVVGLPPSAVIKQQITQ